MNDTCKAIKYLDDITFPPFPKIENESIRMKLYDVIAAIALTCEENKRSLKYGFPQSTTEEEDEATEGQETD
jgi:hypothetical protein